jgi:hypothetical protein
MTVFDQSVHEILEQMKPIGTTWIVLATDTDGIKASYGPFDLYETAQGWIATQTSSAEPIISPDATIFEVLPLYPRS